MTGLKKINLKYASTALIPAKLLDGDALGQKYKLYGGEIVTFRILGTWKNQRDESKDALNEMCRETYNMDFESFCEVWQRRIGELDGYWHKVEMILEE